MHRHEDRHRSRLEGEPVSCDGRNYRLDGARTECPRRSPSMSLRPSRACSKCRDASRTARCFRSAYRSARCAGASSGLRPGPSGLRCRRGHHRCSNGDRPLSDDAGQRPSRLRHPCADEGESRCLNRRAAGEWQRCSKRSARADSEWWARLGLNQRPLRCQRSALPLSYAPVADSAVYRFRSAITTN